MTDLTTAELRKAFRDEMPQRLLSWGLPIQPIGGRLPKWAAFSQGANMVVVAVRPGETVCDAERALAYGVALAAGRQLRVLLPPNQLQAIRASLMRGLSLDTCHYLCPQ